jgi:hypothetical protein
MEMRLTKWSEEDTILLERTSYGEISCGTPNSLFVLVFTSTLMFTHKQTKVVYHAWRSSIFTFTPLDETLEGS